MSSEGGRREVTGWVGWIWFAAAILIMTGAFNIVDGIVALTKDQVYLVSKDQLVILDFTSWGWILLIEGIVQLAVGIALFSGARWARVVAIVMAMLSALTQLVYITAYPLWSIVVIGLDVVVLWALIVHGEEARTASSD